MEDGSWHLYQISTCTHTYMHMHAHTPVSTSKNMPTQEKNFLKQKLIYLFLWKWEVGQESLL